MGVTEVFSGDPRSEEAIKFIREKVEHTLQTSFGKNAHDVTSKFQGKLSTDPANPLIQDLNSADLYGQCPPFTCELQKNLIEEESLPADAVFSANKGNSSHIYLVANVEDVEILIDPTILQFIQGHKHVFVGTRDQLHRLVTNETGEGKPYRIVNTKLHNNPEKAFQRIWGSKSKLYSHPNTRKLQ